MQDQKNQNLQKKTNKENKQNSPVNKLNVYAKYSGLAFQMAIIIGGGTYGGLLLDRKFNNDFKLFTLSLSLLSVFISLYLVIKQVIDDGKKK